MTITVGDIYTAFPTFNPKDMIDLVGKKDFNGRTQVKLQNIARYQGRMAQELSVFTAKKEGKSYTNMLSQTERQKVAQNANLAENKQQQKSVPQNIPMDTSVFDIDRQFS